MSRRALVLGGRGDIGSAIAAELKAAWGDDVLPVGQRDFDLADSASIDRFLAAAGNQFDVLVHSAGLNRPGTFETLDLADVRLAVEANLHGFLRVAQALLPYWKAAGGGRVVVVSSLYGFLARRGRLPYVVSKHGLNGAVKTLAIELAPLGVMVNSVSPGYIETRMTARNNDPATIARLVAGVPVGRLGRPDEVARAASFLASPSNHYITGHDLVVDGGYSIGGFQG